MQKTQTSLVYLQPDTGDPNCFGKQLSSDITPSIKVLPSGTNKSSNKSNEMDTSQFLVDGFTRSSLFRNGENGSGQ